MTDFAQGFYPSPNVEGRDQWWNGTAWTPHTRLSPAGLDERESPPAGPVSSIGAATLPTAIVAAALGFVSLFANPIFIPSLVGILLAIAALAGIRQMPPVGTRIAILVVGATGLVLGLIGLTVEAFS